MQYYETAYWKVILTDNQDYLGRSIIELKRKCGSLSELSKEEWSDFYEVVKKLESVFKQCFDATMFNWTCLMNDAYKSKNPKPQVHWHLRPRYNHPVDVAGMTFVDEEFGHHYTKQRDTLVSRKVLIEITKELKKYL
jgi:diadenosine tetraphosphate (Ap4A) HIT family hydrolase